MLTIKNIGKKIFEYQFCNNCIGVAVYDASDCYKIVIERVITLYDPYTFQPTQRKIEKEMALHRIQRYGKYLLTDGHHFNELTLKDIKDWNLFVARMNEIINQW